jgi:formylglycine-generating enzyme required for sulfatase activity
MVHVPAGTFAMGSDGEGPVHEVTLPAFWIDATAVSNAEFAEFVDATGYVTDAERYEWSFVFAGLLPDEFEDTRGVAQAPWWRQVYGATWRTPEGPQSSVQYRLDHPVVHVSWNDTDAYCRWAKKRMPTEAEWEYAARGGLLSAPFPWGVEREPDGEHRMNVWQGEFPRENSLADGWYGTAPVDAFVPNEYGLYNATGNVWEWCADWFSPQYYAQSPAASPPGPASGTHRVQRGGSYLCHESYCRRYRVSARSANEPDSSTGNLGFRAARDA